MVAAPDPDVTEQGLVGTPELLATVEEHLEFPQHTQGGYAICAQGKVFSGTPSPCVGVTVRGALDGALPSGTLMTDVLRAQNLIPVASTSGTIRVFIPRAMPA